MDVNFMILAHKNPKQLSRLVNTLKSEHAYFYIHIDKNTDGAPFFRECKEHDQLYFIPDEKRRPTPWGDIGAIEATLLMMEKILKDRRTGVCVLLSGQDYPLRPNKEIYNFFLQHRGTHFMENFALPSHRWVEGGLRRINAYKVNLSTQRSDYILLFSIFAPAFYQFKTLKQIFKALISGKWGVFPKLIKKRRFPEYLLPCGGEHWWALPVETVQKIFDFLEAHPDYLEYHRDTLCVDEVFFHSIVAHLNKEKPTAIRPPVTYTNWERPNVPLPVTFNRADISELKSVSANFLFARKFDIQSDEEILNLIDHQLLTQKQGNKLPEKNPSALD